MFWLFPPFCAGLGILLKQKAKKNVSFIVCVCFPSFRVHSLLMGVSYLKSVALCSLSSLTVVYVRRAGRLLVTPSQPEVEIVYLLLLSNKTSDMGQYQIEVYYF